MTTYIVKRRAPDWASIAETYRATGKYDSATFVPRFLPVGFPSDLEARIDLWNSTFSLDFFAIRARIAAQAAENCRNVDGALIYDSSELGAVLTALFEDPDSRVCFVDDDDWFSPELNRVLTRLAGPGWHAVRWAGPVFNRNLAARFTPEVFSKTFVRAYRAYGDAPLLGRVYQQFVRLAARDDGVETVPADLLFMTNNYAINGRFVREMHSLDCVRDHIEASRLFMRADFRVQTLSGAWLSLTNKHPCSAGVLGIAMQAHHPERSLRSYVETFAREAAVTPVPPNLGWAESYIRATASLFAEAL